MGHRIAVRSTPSTGMDEKHNKERILNVTNRVTFTTQRVGGDLSRLNKGSLHSPDEEIFARVT